MVVYSYESKGDIGHKWVKYFIYEAHVWEIEIYMLIYKSQLNNGANSKVSLQKMRKKCFYAKNFFMYKR